MDTLDAILRIEGGDCTEEEIIEAWQSLIDAGIVGQLQGSYQRGAHALINQGICTP